MANTNNRKTPTEKTQRKVPSFEFFFDNSVTTLLQYIRFEAFPSVADSKKRELFYNMSYIACREPPILKTILSKIESDDFQELFEFTRNTKVTPQEFLNNMTCELDEEEAKEFDVSSGKFIQFKKPETIIDSWFEESDPLLAGNLLDYLCFLEQDDKGIQQFMKFYLSNKKDIRMELVSGQNHTMFAI